MVTGIVQRAIGIERAIRMPRGSLLYGNLFSPEKFVITSTLTSIAGRLHGCGFAVNT
jgi:hypothetical protein